MAIRDAKSERWPDSYDFLWIAASAADTSAVNPNGIKTLLDSGLSTFFIQHKPVFSNDTESFPKNPLDCPILCNWVFDNFILADEPFAKALWSFRTCALVNNDQCGKLFSSLGSPTTSDETFKVTSVPFFIPDLIY